MRKKGVKRSGEKLYADVERIEVIEEYKYMGCMVGKELECREMINGRAKPGPTECVLER